MVIRTKISSKVKGITCNKVKVNMIMINIAIKNNIINNRTKAMNVIMKVNKVYSQMITFITSLNNNNRAFSLGKMIPFKRINTLKILQNVQIMVIINALLPRQFNKLVNQKWKRKHTKIPLLLDNKLNKNNLNKNKNLVMDKAFKTRIETIIQNSRNLN